MRLVLILSLALLMPVQPLARQEPAGREVFKPVSAWLRKRTRVPPKLPTYLATEREELPLYAIIEVATPTRYELLLAFSTDCNGANVCRYGMVSGQLMKPKSAHPRGKAMRLVRGITGYFVDATCDAYCSDSTLSRVQGGYRYTVGIKAAGAEQLVRVANSAISGDVVRP